MLRQRWSHWYILILLILLAVPVGVLLLETDAWPDPAPEATLRHSIGLDPLDVGSIPPTAAATASPAPPATATSERTVALRPGSVGGLIAEPDPPTATPEPTPTLPPLGSLRGSAAVPAPPPPSDHLIIPSIRLDARITTAGLTPDNVMEVPDNPFEVAWYTFTAVPGTGGNAVFTGHVDHHTAGRSIFWNLRRVRIGDLVEYRTLDGQLLRYRVFAITSVPADQPANDVVAQTTSEIVTLITCTGSFDRSRLAYDSRLIVQAAREYQ
jgi:LPXTG-site transpeptidase (sortase) family protein